MQFLNNSHHTDTVRLKFESYHLSHIPKATHSKICSHYKTLTKPSLPCIAPPRRIPFPTHTQAGVSTHLPLCTQSHWNHHGPNLPKSRRPTASPLSHQAAPHLISGELKGVYYPNRTSILMSPPAQHSVLYIQVLDYYVKLKFTWSSPLLYFPPVSQDRSDSHFPRIPRAPTF